MAATASQTPQEYSATLEARILDHLVGPGAAWFASELAVIRENYERNRFLAAYAGAARRLRDSAEGFQAIGAARVWPLARCARVVLLVEAVSAAAKGERAALVDHLYATSDNAERAALLGALPALRDPRDYTTTAVEACRTNVVTVFEAIACENPYPAAYFSERAFNQMVLKAVFIGVALNRVEGLASRTNPEMARMAEHYASERRAAGREVPSDLALIL